VAFDSVLGVIPARFASTRLPGKPLALINGRPMVEWVYRSAKNVLSHVVVATDDKRVEAAVKKFGGDVCMTSPKCNSGTDRMKEVASRRHAKFYVNIQGDEPMMKPATIRDAVKLAIRKKAISTAATHLEKEHVDDPSAVKVVVDKDGRALYFSRSMIPYAAHGVTKPLAGLKHLGLYVYPKEQLFKFARLKPTQLEQTEKLEQLRALYNGMSIYVAYTPFDSIGVDTPADLKRVSQKLGA
jgi:3-deoxy-manno-octulosonate cytidylyltransferase (CMP-KDO synthetase)